MDTQSNQMHDIEKMRRLSPRRSSSQASDVDGLVAEQLEHFGITPDSPFGQRLARIASNLYRTQDDVDQLWDVTLKSIHELDHPDRIARFNAKKFLSFQLAKVLDTLQNPFRSSYQSLSYGPGTVSAKGPYAIIDNIGAIFSANPVIARTATYIYACAEWIGDAFEGKEQLLGIYSRLLNPTSISLANHIVDLEAGPYADEYLAWNFNSGMAAIDAALSHIIGREDVLITSSNLYGGAHQLIHDWFAKPSNLGIAVERFDGYTTESFLACCEQVKHRYPDRFAAGRKVYVYLESPCNPHGYVLDVARICKEAHRLGMRVLLDATVATPFLSRPIQRTDPAERPDFVIHSYTKDLSGTGSVIAGVVIGRNEDMFIPKGEPGWDQTMFWNVYYIKGAFLNADAAYEVLQGMRTLEGRMLTKCINTLILARFMDSHSGFDVACNALDSDPNAALCRDQMALGLPAPLFTVDLPDVPRSAFQRFFDNLSPTFNHMISLGQSNTIVSCPGLTTHSELDEKAQAEGGITPTTIRIAVGDEDPADLLAHLVAAAKLAIDPAMPGFSDKFPPPDRADTLIRDCYMEAHTRFADDRRTVNSILKRGA